MREQLLGLDPRTPTLRTSPAPTDRVYEAAGKSRPLRKESRGDQRLSSLQPPTPGPGRSDGTGGAQAPDAI